MEPEIRDGLRSMKEICEFTGYSRRVVIKLKSELNFPMALIGGKWESSKNMIEDWRKKVLTGENCQKIY